MAKKYVNMPLRGKKVIYSLNQFELVEYNEYTNIIFYYDLLSRESRDFFQARLKHNSRYKYKIIIESSTIFYLHNIKWL